ncbi:MAG: SDR family NAD(P)-dependent oxidoreductase [Actinomycetota bacterium]|nr:SDR family NAD(P)-dependent oxidoreductase [Actinomycetota bacterium]
MTTSEPTSNTGERAILITGTSTGIGLAAAVAAAQVGWRTVATMRDPGKAAALRSAADAAGVTVDVRALDVTKPDSIATCVESVVADLGHLDAVLNNAGAAHVGTIETDDLTAVRACLEVNFFGVVQLTQAVLPALRAARGRLVTVTSVGGVVGQPFNEAYCAAKFAVEGFMESLAPVAATTGVGVSVVEPGPVASEFVTNAGLDPETMLGEAGAYAGALRAYLTRVSSQFAGNAQPAAEVANIIVALLSDPAPPFRVQTSDWARQFVASKLADVDGSAVQAFTTPWVTS